MALLPTGADALPRLSVVVRGDSFRPQINNSVWRRVDDLEADCNRASLVDQWESTSSHLKLLRALSSTFSLSVSLFTYAAGRCTHDLPQLYSQPSLYAKPSLTLLDRESNTQGSMWRTAFSAVTDEHAASLVLRYDLLLLDPEETAERLRALHGAAPRNLVVAFPWVDPFWLDPVTSCRAYAHLQSTPPLGRAFLADTLHFVPRNLFPLVRNFFPEHDSTDCLLSQIEGRADAAGAELSDQAIGPSAISYLFERPASTNTANCSNPVFVLNTRERASEPCVVPTDDDFLAACAQCMSHPFAANATHLPPGRQERLHLLRTALMVPIACENAGHSVMLGHEAAPDERNRLGVGHA